MKRREIPKSEPNRLRKLSRIFFRIFFSNVGLSVAVLIYLIIGGFLFQYLENEKKLDGRLYFQKYREQCVHDLWAITKSLQVLYKQNWTMAAIVPLRKFEIEVTKAISAERQFLVRAWSFADSFFYSVTILTTIGYNNHTPKTTAGKIATILYASVGIPLMLICVCNMGILLSEWLQLRSLEKAAGSKSVYNYKALKKAVYEMPAIVKKDTVISMNSKQNGRIRHTVLNQKAVKRKSESNVEQTDYSPDCMLCVNGGDEYWECCDKKSCCDIINTEKRYTTKSHTTEQQVLKNKHRYASYFPIIIVITAFTTYMCSGGAVYSLWRDESFMNGVYFCFLSITTIGSCEMFKNLFSSASGAIELTIYCSYIFVGLMLLATVFFIIQKIIIKPELNVRTPCSNTDEVAL